MICLRIRRGSILSTLVSRSCIIPNLIIYMKLNLIVTKQVGSSQRSKSKSRYNRRSAGQSVLVSRPIWVSCPNINYCLTMTILSMSGALSDERSGLSSHLNCFSSIILLLAFASYFISDCLWSVFFTSKRHRPSHHVKVAVALCL
jgi:hypothetical protein